MTLHVHFSNRFEALSDALGEALFRPADDPFAVDAVVVHSIAVRRRLTLDLARRHHVCANLRFDYLGAWLWRQAAAQLSDVRPQSPFDADRLAWMVLAALDDEPWMQAYPRLARYASRADATLRYELAQRIAKLLSDYTTWRNDWLEAWQQSRSVIGRGEGGAPPVPAELIEDERWLSALWTRIAGELRLPARNPLRQFADAVADPSVALSPRLPGRVHVFALPATPPLHLEVLQALGRRLRVDLYVLNPCREYWVDTVSERQLAWLRRIGREALHEVGHRLLAGWGGQARAQQAVLIEHLQPDVEREPYVEPEGDTLLAQLQRSMLELREPAPGSLRVAEQDRSIELHVCHSRVRELEVLHARLLGLFRDQPDLQASQVLVALPDLEQSAPLIEAVFGTVPPERSIPYTVTGLPGSRSNPVAQVLLEVLEFAGSRWPASGLHALLARAAIARRFDLDEADLERLRDWITQGGLRWGADADHRRQLGLPAEPAHSATDALERLFLSYALPEQADAPWQGRLPAGDVEGMQARALGALSRFVDQLRRLRRAMAQPRTAAQWAAIFERTLQAFIASARSEAEDRHAVSAAIRAFAGSLPEPMVDAALEPEVALLALRERLDVSSPGGVPSGRVTFASMKDLRALPYEVVCVIGLDDGLFPALDRPLEFDLMARLPRAGDRQRRADDRNAFLDLVLSARRVLHLSHVGRGQRDNAVLPPSVLVSELLDWVMSVAVPEGAEASESAEARLRRQLVIEHPLQPFSPRAFGLVDGADPRLISFDTEFAQAINVQREAQAGVGAGAASKARAGEGDTSSAADDDLVEDAEGQDEETLAQALRALPPFIDEPLPVAGPEWRDITPEQLIAFLRSPARYLLERRLQIAIERPQAELPDAEPFALDFSAHRALAKRLVPPLIDPASAGHLHTADAEHTGTAAGARAGVVSATRVDASAQGVARVQGAPDARQASPSADGAPTEPLLALIDDDLPRTTALARAGTELPHGVLGDALAAESAQRSVRMAQRVLDAREGDDTCSPEDVITLIEDEVPWRLQVRPGEVHPGGLVLWQSGQASAAEEINAWVRHLMLCATAPEGVELRTTLVDDAGGVVFNAVRVPSERPKGEPIEGEGEPARSSGTDEGVSPSSMAMAGAAQSSPARSAPSASGSEAASGSAARSLVDGAPERPLHEGRETLDRDLARAFLADLVRLYARGLREPVPFFPKSAFAYAKAAAKAGGLYTDTFNKAGRNAAFDKWKGNSYGPKPTKGEREDAWLRVAFRGHPDPVIDVQDEFANLARRVLGPMLAWRVQPGPSRDDEGSAA